MKVDTYNEDNGFVHTLFNILFFDEYLINRQFVISNHSVSMTLYSHYWLPQMIYFLPRTNFAGDSGGTQNITNVSKDNKAHGKIKMNE